MNRVQFLNLLDFCTIFISGSFRIETTSPDYFEEKYKKYIGIYPVKEFPKSEYTLEYEKTWGICSQEVNNIFYFIDKITENITYNKWLMKPGDLLKCVDEFFGDSKKINNERYNHIHPVLHKNIIEPYIKENLRYFKLLNILKYE